MQGADGLREPELLARLRKPRVVVALLGAGLLWLLLDAQRPESKARGAAAAVARGVAAEARALAVGAAAPARQVGD